MSKEIEFRALAPAVELRAARLDDGRHVLSGLAAPFHTRSEDLGGFVETIQPGAFKRSLATRPVVALAAHRTYPVFGRTDNGSLKLRESERGLEFELDLPTGPDGALAPSAADLWAAVNRGDVRGMSFGFTPEVYRWDDAATPPVRSLEDVELYEVTFTAFPAYPGTSAAVALRSLDAWRAEHAPEPPPTPKLDALRQRIAHWQAVAPSPAK